MFIEAVHAATEAAQGAEHATESNVLGTFGLDWKLFLGQLVNFAILLYVLNRWVYKPLLKTMDARKAKIEKGIRDSSEAEKRLAEAKEKEREVITHARHEAKEILHEAKSEGESLRDTKVNESQVIIDQRTKEAEDSLARERDEAQNELKRELAGLIFDTTQKVSSGTIDEKKQRDLIAKSLQELERVNV